MHLIEAGTAKPALTTSDVRRHCEALAAAIVRDELVDPVHVWALYRIFAAYFLPPEERQSILWSAGSSCALVYTLNIVLLQEAAPAQGLDQPIDRIADLRRVTPDGFKCSPETAEQRAFIRARVPRPSSHAG